MISPALPSFVFDGVVAALPVRGAILQGHAFGRLPQRLVRR